MQKYKIRAATNPDMFISKAKVVVLAVDIDCLQDIPEVAASIRDKIPPNALINSNFVVEFKNFVIKSTAQFCRRQARLRVFKNYCIFRLDVKIFHCR